jgi:hypothetical protein
MKQIRVTGRVLVLGPCLTIEQVFRHTQQPAYHLVFSSATYARTGHDIVLQVPGRQQIHLRERFDSRPGMRHEGVPMRTRRRQRFSHFEMVAVQADLIFSGAVEVRRVGRRIQDCQTAAIGVEVDVQAEESYSFACTACFKNVNWYIERKRDAKRRLLEGSSVPRGANACTEKNVSFADHFPIVMPNSPRRALQISPASCLSEIKGHGGFVMEL